ncbi:MAG: GNAT family N-acetyltransferase [Rhodobacteraceae bacterium]|nr:GNAT family N-acetyltransferase [Paracoccaceae bacterium]
MKWIVKGRYRARISNKPDDVLAAQRLRSEQFSLAGAEKARTEVLDRDQFDGVCQHAVIEDVTTGELAACFRFLHLRNSELIDRSYSAQFYNLDRLKSYPYPLLEIGRFCIRDGQLDPDIPRMAWALLTRYVDANRIGLMFGCSSFQGTEISAYLDAFALLKDRHLAPDIWAPKVKAPEVVRYCDLLAHESPARANAARTMPSLLRTYLTMGGWVSDHAVIDRHLNTLHVFTGVEISAISPMRKMLLRADAA